MSRGRLCCPGLRRSLSTPAFVCVAFGAVSLALAFAGGRRPEPFPTFNLGTRNPTPAAAAPGVFGGCGEEGVSAAALAALARAFAPVVPPCGPSAEMIDVPFAGAIGFGAEGIPLALRLISPQTVRPECPSFLASWSRE